MKRKDHPAASPPKRRAGHAIGAVPPESRASNPAQGKRNAKIVIARVGLPEAVTASARARMRTGSRTGPAGGNPTAKSSPEAATDSRNRRTRVPVPGDRFIGLSVHRFICLENQLSRTRIDDPMTQWSDSSSPPVVLLEGG